MRTLMYLFIFIIGFHSAFAINANKIQKIIFFRHGEKPTLDFGQLVCKGLNRAIALPDVLKKKYGKPDYIFTPYPYWGGFYYYVRAFVTIEPTAIRLQMPVNTIFYYHEVDKTADFLLDDIYHSAVVYVPWEHKNIYKIARKIFAKLDADTNVIPQWKHDDYDSIYVLTIDWNYHPAKVQFKHEQQNLNHVSDECSVEKTTAPTNTQKLYREFYFIPAAEKVLGASDQLSCQGLNRALLLPQVLQKLAPEVSLFVLPAPKEIKNLPEFQRALMTIEPTIINRGGLYIPAGHKDISLLNKNELTKFGTVIITWPMYDLANVARALYKENGGDPNEIPAPVTNRNTIYRITLSKNRYEKPIFTILDENIGTPAERCP